MSSKRVAAREWKRKRNQRKMIIKLAALAVCLVIVAGLGYLGWDSWSRSTVMTFNGHRIPTSDAQFFYMGGITGMPKEQAAEDLVTYLLIEEAAARNNVSLTAEDRAELADDVDGTRNFFDMFGISIPRVSDDRLADFIGQELLIERLAAIYVPNVEIDDDEFSTAFFNYQIFHRHEFVDMDLMFFETQSFESALNVRESLLAADTLEEKEEIIIIADIFGDVGEDFELHNIDIPDAEVNRITLAEISGIEHTILMNLASLHPGNVSDPFEIEGMIYVFVVESLSEPPLDELEVRFRDELINERRMDAFEYILSGWRDNADVQFNQRGINSI